MMRVELVLFALVFFFIILMKRDIIESTFETFVTSAPPVLPRDVVPWAGTFSMLSKDVHKANSPMLVNYWPMGKPPKYVEEVLSKEEVDIARPQFIPHMAAVKNPKSL